MPTDRDTRNMWTGRVDPEPDSRRWHQCITALAPESPPGVAIIGFACDEGVRRNHGRPGAAGAPHAIRRTLGNLAWHRSAPVFDAGDVVCGDGDLEAAQTRLAHCVATLLTEGHFPIVLGGGHEVAYGSWQGLAAHLAAHDTNPEAPPRIGIINFDAHFDLRDPTHGHTSGTPFAQIAAASIARGWPFRYACLGVSRAANTRALFTRAAALEALVREDRDIDAASLAALGAELDDFIDACDALHLSIDLDVLPASEAPGVSAPAARGVSLTLIEPLLERIRDCGKLRLAEVAELNPELDIDNRSARAAARLIHTLTLDE